MKIAVLMWYDDNIKEYADVCFKINKLVTNCDVIKCNKRRCPERHQTWERMPLMLEYMENTNYDWFVWIDADAPLNKDSKYTIENICKDNDDKDLLFSWSTRATTTIGFKDPKGHLNAGLYFVKNSEYGKNYLKYLFDCKEQYWWKGWREQTRIIQCLRKNEFDLVNHSKILYGLQSKPEWENFTDYWLNNNNNENLKDVLVYHWWGQTTSARIKLINNLYNQTNI